MKSLVLSIFEVSILRFILAGVRLSSFVGYRKKKLDWGVIQRSEISKISKK